MIIILGSQKGGVGKSTLAVNLCAELANQGKDVILVDADRQCSSSNWVSDRNENPELATVNCVKQYDNIKNTLRDLDTRYEYVIVDAAGRDSKELRYGLIAAHVLLMPVKPSQFDLDTVSVMQEIVAEVKEEFNPDLKFKAVISMASTNPVIDEAGKAKGFFSNFLGIELLPFFILERKVYRDAAFGGLGKGVVEMNNEKAKWEIRQLLNEVLK